MSNAVVPILLVAGGAAVLLSSGKKKGTKPSPNPGPSPELETESEGDQEAEDVEDEGSGAKPAPSGGSGTKPAPSGGSGTKPAPSGGSGTKPAPSGGSGTKPAPSGGSGTKPAPSGGSGTKPAPSGGSGTKPAPSGGSGKDIIVGGIPWGTTILRKKSPRQTGAKVRSLQRVLCALGVYDQDTVNTFGPKTEAAVKAFQKQGPNPVTADGVVGPQTTLKMYEALQRGGQSPSTLAQASQMPCPGGGTSGGGTSGGGTSGGGTSGGGTSGGGTSGGGTSGGGTSGEPDVTYDFSEDPLVVTGDIPESSADYIVDSITYDEIAWYMEYRNVFVRRDGGFFGLSSSTFLDVGRPNLTLYYDAPGGIRKSADGTLEVKEICTQRCDDEFFVRHYEPRFYLRRPQRDLCDQVVEDIRHDIDDDTYSRNPVESLANSFLIRFLDKAEKYLKDKEAGSTFTMKNYYY